jgi:hypothetical protein
VNGFIDHLYTRLGTSSSYSATANLHKSPQHSLSLFQPAVFTSRSLATASHSGDSSRAQFLSSQPLVKNSTDSTESQESESLHDWRFTANQFVLATSPLRLTISNFIFQLNTCGYSPYVTSSLTRGCVCRLQLLLVLARAVILGYFTVSDSRLPQPGGPSPCIYIPQEQGGPVIPPGIGVPFRRLLRLAGLRWKYS